MNFESHSRRLNGKIHIDTNRGTSGNDVVDVGVPNSHTDEIQQLGIQQ